MPVSLPLTNLFSYARPFCLAIVLNGVVQAHGQTSCPTSDNPTQAKCQMKCAGPNVAQTVNLTVNKTKTRFRLRNGLTSFVIPLLTPNQPRCFTLENENAAAKGTLSIATATKRLAVNDANWNVVAGAVRFRQKRQFYLSLVGVEAKYVRLTFQVDGPSRIVRPD